MLRADQGNAYSRREEQKEREKLELKGKLDRGRIDHQRRLDGVWRYK